MEHPLITGLDQLNVEQLSDRINELHKKLSIAARMGNGHVCDQIRMAIESYTNKLRQIQNDQARASQQNFNDKINIS